MPTRVVVPWVTIHPLTERALEAHASAAERFYVGHNDTAYWQLLHDLWDSGADLVVVEHDIEIHADVLPGFEACDQPWCTHAYPGAGWNQPGNPLLERSLGCTRFSAALQDAQPDLIAQTGDVTEGHPARDWRRLDVLVMVALDRLGYRPCVHEPPVRHHHHYAGPGPSTGCACGETHEEVLT